MINILLSTPLVQLFAEATEVSLWNELLIPLIVVLILVVLNGFFVAAEFAVLGARPTKMEQLSDEGNKRAERVLGILENPNEQNSYLATAQLGITVVTLVLAAYGEPRIAHYLEATIIEPLLGPDVSSAFVHTVGYLVSLSLLTYFHVVIGEMVPKSIALSEPNVWVLKLTPLMRALQWVFGIPIRILNAIGDMLLRLIKIEPEHGHARLYSSEEIELIVSESTEGGLITEDAEEIIGNILDFHDREVGQVMTPRSNVQGFPVDIVYDELIGSVVGSKHSRFPVFEGDLDHIVGILHLKDLLKHYRNGRENFKIRELLRPVPVVPEDHSVTELLKAIKLQRIHMAVVLDEYGGVAGIVTLEDLVEEIVGEVRDEFDQEREPLVELADGVLDVEGSYLLDDLKEKIFLGEDDSLPDVDTVGGLVVTLLGGPPMVNDEVSLENGVSFKVTATDRRAVLRLRVEYPTLTPEVDESEHE